jgi:hypothetical protein
MEEVTQVFNKKSIDSKKDCYLLYENNLFGNRAETWNSLQEVSNSSWKDTICIRAKKRVGSKNTIFDIPLSQVPQEVDNMIKNKTKKEDIYFIQTMPNKHLLIQAEVMLTEQGLYLQYTTIKKPMNLGFKEETLHAYGLKALNLLKSNLSPPSLQDLNALFELFPNSIIEFSCYNVPVGTIPGRNTVIWEVRNY